MLSKRGNKEDELDNKEDNLVVKEDDQGGEEKMKNIQDEKNQFSNDEECSIHEDSEEGLPKHTFDDTLDKYTLHKPGSRSSFEYQKDPITKADNALSKQSITADSAVNHDGPAISFKRESELPETARAFMTSELFQLFLEDQTNEFMKLIDTGGRNEISKKQFVNLIIQLYETRKQLLALVESQTGIRTVFRRMVAIFLTFFALLIFLIVLGVSVNTIVISGAASISSITVAMSFLYSGFIQSVLFVCFLNPYDIGDRVRLDNDNLYTIARISTYFTEMWDVHGKLTFFNHSLLYNMLIKNESRCKHAGLEIPFMIAYDTPPWKYEALHRATEDYVQRTPEHVKDSFFCIMNEVVVGHYIKFTYWCTCIDSWHLWKSVWTIRGKLIQSIIRQCKTLEIQYRLPAQPCALSGMAVFDSKDHLLHFK